MNSMLIGIGMNIKEENFPDELKEIATSLKKEYGIEAKREEILESFLEKLEKMYINKKG